MGTDLHPIDWQIGLVAAKQQNDVTREQLLALGLGAKAIAYRVRVGRLYREYPGVYSVGKPATTAAEKASAAVLACGRAALSHSSSLTHWGVWKRWDIPFEVSLIVGDRRPKGITVHHPKSLNWHDTVVHNGIRATKLARTILDMTPRLSDEELWRTVDSALHTPYLTRGQLADQLERNPNHRGATRLRKYVFTRDGATRSDWERAFPAFCEQYGLPRPRLIARSAGNEVDAIFEPEGLIVELDSWEFHSSRSAFERDRDRDADNLALDRQTIRITWDRLIYKADREAERLHRILAWLRRRKLAA
jgi:hypothetical protein